MDAVTLVGYVMNNDRTFLVEVNIVLPIGEKAEDWKYVKHIMEDVNESNIDEDIANIQQKIYTELQMWRATHETVHDCLMHSELSLDADVYACYKCGEDTTTAIKERLKLVKEREVNPHATSVVYA